MKRNKTKWSEIEQIIHSVRVLLFFRLFSNYLHGQFGQDSHQFHNDVLNTVDVLNRCTAYRSMTACLYDENIMRSYRVSGYQ